MPSQIVTSAYRYLFASGVPATLVAEGLLGSDAPPGPFASGWVFSADLNGDPYRTVEGTGKCAIVLYSYDHWSPATQLHTIRFPRLNVGIYADVSRDADGNNIAHDAERKIERIYDRINPLFHDAANRVHSFDGLRVIDTVQGSALSLMAIPDGDGATRGTVGYDLTIG